MVKLELENGPTVTNPDAVSIGKALTGVRGFGILSQDPMTYMQASGSAQDGFCLEYQEGDTDQRYCCPGPLSLECATNAFVSYARGDEAWRTLVEWRKEPAGDATKVPAIRRHIGWVTFFEFAGPFCAATGYICYKFRVGYFPRMWVEGLWFLGLCLAGFIIPRFIFRKIIGARCNAPGCRGKTFPKRRNPILYVCNSCRRTYDTGTSEGDSGTIGPLP